VTTGFPAPSAYRYLDEVIGVLAEQAPDLHQALRRATDEGLTHVILDGTVIATDRCREKTISVKGEPIDGWYSGKARHPPRLAAHLAARPTDSGNSDR
jgi:hypothetical protein